MGKLFADNVVFRDGNLVVEENGQIQEIIATSDTKQFFTTAVNTFFMDENPAADTQWEQIYRVVQGRGSGMLLPYRPPDAVNTVEGTSFLAAEDEASAGSHGVVFERVGEGGEIKFSRVVAAEKYLKHVKYGTAIGYSNEWFSDGEMAMIEMVTEDFRDAAADKLAAIHYGAIVAAVDAGISSSTSYSAASSGSATVGIINTLNTICATMQRARRRPAILLCAPENESAIRMALRQTNSAGVPAVQTERVSRLTPLVTEYLAANTAYIIEPKRRLISSNRLPLSLGSFEDLLRDSEVLVGKFRRGVLVGEGAVIHAMTSVPTALDSDVDI